MFTFVIMRYSVLGRQGGRRANRRTREALFNPDRLRQREWLFEHVALKSLVEQRPALDPASFRLLVYTAEELPAENRARLDAMLAPYPWAEVIETPDDRRYGDLVHADVPRILSERFPDRAAVLYATLRFDDDDALSFDFMQRIRRYVARPHLGTCISFGLGYAAWVDERGQYLGFRSAVFPHVALGLAYIDQMNTRTGQRKARYPSVLALGAHHRVFMRAPTLLSCRKPAWVRTLYRGQDSNSIEREFYHEGPLVSPEVVAKIAPVAEEMLVDYRAGRSEPIPAPTSSGRPQLTRSIS